MKQGFYKNIMHAMTQILSGLLAAMMLVSIVGVTGSLSVKANNYTDTYYSLKYYGDGGDVRTGSTTIYGWWSPDSI